MLNNTRKSLMAYFTTWEEVVYYYNYRRRHMPLPIDDSPVVKREMVYEKKVSRIK
ncbi:MAG: hypothetical protein QXZ44_03545 [Ferroplasma sp.]